MSLAGVESAGTAPPRAVEGGRHHPVARYAARRIAAGVLTLIVLSVLVFTATSVLPGDAASAILGKQARGPQLRHLRTEMGLNHSIARQYADWVGGLLRGNLGNSATGYAAGGHV